MKFEVINDKNKVVMHTEHISCIPPRNILNSMSKSGYKFKLNGKSVTVNKLNERLKETSNEENN